MPFDQSLLARLRRWPDVEADNLYPYDATDRLLLDETADALSTSAPGEVIVIGDTHGALTLGARMLGARDVRVWQDALVSEQALDENAARLGVDGGYRHITLNPAEFTDARLVLMQLPRSLDQLRMLADLITDQPGSDLLLVAGGRVKHMTPTMNDVLRTRFGEVHASLARQKSRLIFGSDVLPGSTAQLTPAKKRGQATQAAASQSAARATLDPGHGIRQITVCAVPGAFAGAALDIGTRALLPHLPCAAADAATSGTTSHGASGDAHAHFPVAIDLGCGTGIIAAVLARSAPDLRVIATDQLQSAVASAAQTIAANALSHQVTVMRDMLLRSQPDASADLIACNPPFHVGAAVHTGTALAMFRESARVLRPGSTLLTVFNSHLHYAADLEHLVGPTDQLDRNSKFTVTRSVRR